MNSIHKTKGIVVKTVKYGDTSLIATIYTEVFGMQSYIVKGVRKPTKKGLSNNNYFMPGALLDLQVFHNEQKQLQFIKEYSFSKIYISLFSNVVKNSATLFCLEILHHSIIQPESNPTLFYFIEESFILLDVNSDDTLAANYSIYFSIRLADYLGFGIQNNFSTSNKILDLQQGFFTQNFPTNNHYLNEVLSQQVSHFLCLSSLAEVSSIKLNQHARRGLIDGIINYFSLHITQFTNLKTVEVLRQIF